MRQQLERRLQQLRQELEAGQQALTELERRQMTLRDTLLRISGAAQVLEEELQRADEPGAVAPPPAGDTDGRVTQSVTP